MKRAEEILAALKNGEEKAFKTFFSEYHDVLVLCATNILKDFLQKHFFPRKNEYSCHMI